MDRATARQRGNGSPLIGTAELPLAELCAARLDGELYTVAGLFCPIDLPSHPALRAAGLAGLMPHGSFVERLSAAWLHGAVDQGPRRLQLALPSTAGARPRFNDAFAMRQVVVTDPELTTVGGCLVTTPRRTLVDLLLDNELSDAAAIAAADALARVADLSPRAARSGLRMRYRLPQTALAERRIRLWGASQPSLTRYTS